MEFFGVHPVESLSGDVELFPPFRTQPHLSWADQFRLVCEESAEIDWYDAGFARCAQADVEVVTAALEAAAAAADAALARALRHQ